MRWSLWGSDGERWDLTDCDSTTQMGASIHGAHGLPPMEIASSRRYNLPAGEHRGEAYAGARTLTVRLVLKARSRDDLADEIDRLALSLDPRWGDCRVEVERDSGESRSIFVTYTGGLAGDVRLDERGRWSTRITLKAHDPFWLSSLRPEVRIDLPVTGSGSELTDWDDPAVDWDDLNVPWDGFDSGSAGVASFVSHNVGTAECWPIWEIDGPAETVRLANMTTGEAWLWEGTMLTGSMLVDFGKRLILVNGVNGWPGLKATRDWWPLRPGPQFIVVEVTGSDTNTRLRMRYHARFLSP